MGSLPEFFWLLFLFAVTGAGPALLFVWLVRTRRRQLAAFLLGIMAIGSVAMALNLTYGMGIGIFGGGLSCLVLPVTALSLIAVIATRANTWRLVQGDLPRRRLYVIGAVLVPLLLLAPLPGEIAIVATCDALNRRAGDTVVQALKTYRNDHQAYPDDLASLVPGYLPALPQAHCFAPFGWFHGPEVYPGITGAGFPPPDGAVIRLERCVLERATLVTVPSIRFEFIQRCDPSTGVWSRVSFLDGTCSYLK
jgi:hypothetical protein